MMKKLTLTFLLSILLVVTASVSSAFAAESKINVTQDIGKTATIVNAIEITPKPGTNTTTNFKPFTVSGKTLTFDNEIFEAGTEKSQKQALKTLVAELNKQNVSEQVQKELVDGLSVQSRDVGRMMIPLMMDSTSADLFTAMKWMSPFMSPIRVFFGILAFGIVIALVLSTIIDLAFIGLPIAREMFQNKGDNSSNGKVPWVTSDAQSVINEVEGGQGAGSSGGYKNAYLMYFKRRIFTYIILSFCLLYLVVGELGGLISWLLSLGTGIVSE